MKTARIYYDTEFLEGMQDIRLFGVKTGFKTKPTIDLISIGMIDEKGNEYYAISKDFNLKEAWNRYDIKTEVMSGDARNLFPYGKKTKVYWIRENVLKPIWREWAIRSEDEWFAYASEEEYADFLLEVNRGKFDDKFTFKNFKKLLKKYGKSNKEIASEVIQFCSTEEVVVGNPYDILVRTKRTKHNKEIELYGYYSAYDHCCLCWLFGKMIDLPPGMPMYTKDLKQIFDQKQEKIDNIAQEKVEQLIDQSEHQGAMFFDRTEYNLKKHPAYPKQLNEHSAIHDAKWNKQLHEFLNNL